MKPNQIRVGQRYETNLGHGTCRSVSDEPPRSVRVDIDWPLRRGEVRLRPRDVVGRGCAAPKAGK